MNPFALQNERLLVPRWRPLAATLQSRELAAPRRPDTQIKSGEQSSELTLRKEAWRVQPTLISAAELVEIALIEAKPEEGIEAARRIMLLEKSSAPLIRAQAATLLIRAGLDDEVPEAARQPSRPENAAFWRRMTRVHQNDPLAWVELALYQTISGAVDTAAKTMAVALQLAPDNRHVLRSAARLYLHRDERERAHDLIWKNPATRQDPWLMAAEIALARVASRSPKMFKMGKNFIEDGDFLPRQITELAGAVGTAELFDGSRKKSKRMFQQSLVDPTGSALAQAEWVTPHFGTELVSIDKLRMTNEAYEAIAIYLYRGFKFADAAKVCDKWANVDPYSIRPFEFGATCAGYAEQFEVAVQISKTGLSRKPDAPTLLNAISFALSNLGRLSEAKAYLKMVKSSRDTHIAYLTKANEGHIAFRSGNHNEGVILYREAIEGFRKINLQQLSAHARVQLAKEASRANLPEAGSWLIEAEKAMAIYPKSEGAFVLANFKNQKPAEMPSEEELNSIEKEEKYSRLRSVTYTTPGLPYPPRKLIL